MNAIFANPFTSALGAATFIAGVFHLWNANFNIDPQFLASIFSALGLFAAKDAGTK